MAILRSFLAPTVGTPQPVAARRKLKNMIQPEFYQEPEESEEQQDQNFQRPPESANYIQEQLARYKGKAAPPELEPGARVKSASMELVQPSNFKSYYEQLSTIDRSGQEMLGAAQARAAFKRLQAMQSVSNQTPPARSGSARSGSQSFGRAGAGAMPAPGNLSEVQSTVRNIASQYGWSGGEWDALYRLIMKESGFRPNAANPTSSARGLFQKMTSIHGPIESTVEGQARWGLDYIRRRYGSPSRALAFHLSHNWY